MFYLKEAFKNLRVEHLFESCSHNLDLNRNRTDTLAKKNTPTSTCPPSNHLSRFIKVKAHMYDFLFVLPFSLTCIHNPLKSSQARLSFLIPPLQCICINCEHVTNCSAYHFVETQHSQPHVYTGDPLKMWEPLNGNPTINATIRSSSTNKSNLWSDSISPSVPATGSDTTVEYDVIKCASFVHSPDKWLSNIPQEILSLNPTFVPS